MSKIRVVHYINQFFAGVGGEEKAHIAPELRTELPPISVQLQGKLGEEFEVVATVVCGDSYFNENLEKVQAELIDMIKDAILNYLSQDQLLMQDVTGLQQEQLLKLFKTNFIFQQ